jgi:hypothetical protein
MDDVIHLYGNCQAEPCKRGDVKIIDEHDQVTVRGKTYHKGCQPSAAELAALDRA